MSKTIAELKTKNLERGHGITAEEIAECIGQDDDFDERIVQTSPRRFKEIMNAYTKKACSDGKEESAITFDKDKTFKSISDMFLADQLSGKFVIEALQYGIFRISGESSEFEKANKAKNELMLYLIEMNSPDVKVLSEIEINEPGTLTLEEFLSSKKEYAKKRFSIYSEHSTDRFDRIFSYIRKQTKKMYETSQKDRRRRIRKGEFPLSLKEKLDISNEAMNNVVMQQNEIAQSIHDKKDAAINAFKEKVKYSHTHILSHKNITTSTKYNSSLNSLPK